MAKLQPAYTKAKKDQREVNKMFSIWASLINQGQHLVQEERNLNNIDKSVSHLESEKALISIELVSLDKEQTYHNLVSDMKDLLLRHNQGHQHKVMPALEYKIAIVWEWVKDTQLVSRIADLEAEIMVKVFRREHRQDLKHPILLMAKKGQVNKKEEVNLEFMEVILEDQHFKACSLQEKKVLWPFCQGQKHKVRVIFQEFQEQVVRELQFNTVVLPGLQFKATSSPVLPHQEPRWPHR